MVAYFRGLIMRFVVVVVLVHVKRYKTLEMSSLHLGLPSSTNVIKSVSIQRVSFGLVSSLSSALCGKRQWKISVAVQFMD